jgi:hypothetical protein
MAEKSLQFNFLSTGIGSVPFQGIEDTCRLILDLFPSMPFWPQFVKRSYLEDMSAQYCEGLPMLEINEQEKTLVISSDKHAESELTDFYEHFLAKDIDHFSMSRDFAPGLYSMLDLIERGKDDFGPYIKGQTVGPVTFAAGILDKSGKPLLHNAELLEAMVNGLAIKAVWQARELRKTGKKPVIFMDEPYLSGFGSAFSPIQRQEVINILKTLIEYLRENSDALIGIHCCGNTDWSMIVDAGPDIINFDAFEFMGHFLLYPDEIVRFFDGGGTVAWGIIPTSAFSGRESVDGLISKLQEGLGRVHDWGIDSKMLAEKSILTPACGMGTMDPQSAKQGMDLLSRLSGKLKEMGVV